MSTFVYILQTKNVAEIIFQEFYGQKLIIFDKSVSIELKTQSYQHIPSI